MFGRTPRIPGELWSVATMRTTATESCILHFLRWRLQVLSFTPLPTREDLPAFKAQVAFKAGPSEPHGVCDGGDILNCNKPQSGAAVKRLMLLRRGRWNRDLQTLLVFSLCNEKDSLSPGPAWVSCLRMDVRYMSICHSTANQHAHYFWHAQYLLHKHCYTDIKLHLGHFNGFKPTFVVIAMCSPNCSFWYFDTIQVFDTTKHV